MPPAVAKLKSACARVSDESLREALAAIGQEPQRFSPVAAEIIESELKCRRRRNAVKDQSKDADVARVVAASKGTPSAAGIACMLALLMTGAVYVWQFVRSEGGDQPSVTATAGATCPTRNDRPKLTSCSLKTVLRLTHDDDPDVRDEAVFELGRRGAVAELEQLESHPKPDVRAAVPLAMLLAGRTAHSRIPHLADQLASPDESVRQNTITALRTLVTRYGTYREAPEVAADDKRSVDRR